MTEQNQGLKVGPTRFSEGGTVMFGRYSKGGGIAIQVVDETGPLYTATVNIPEAPPNSHCVWLKGWSENEGVPEALAQAGVVKLTGVTWPLGHVTATSAILTRAAREALAKSDS